MISSRASRQGVEGEGGEKKIEEGKGNKKGYSKPETEIRIEGGYRCVGMWMMSMSKTEQTDHLARTSTPRHDFHQLLRTMAGHKRGR